MRDSKAIKLWRAVGCARMAVESTEFVPLLLPPFAFCN